MVEEFKSQFFDSPSYLVEMKKEWNDRIVGSLAGKDFVVSGGYENLTKQVVDLLRKKWKLDFADKNLTPKTGYQRKKIEVPVSIGLNGINTNVIVKFEIIVDSSSRNFPPTIDHSYIDRIEVIKSYFE